MGVIDKIQENTRNKYLDKKVAQITALASKYEAMTDDQLKEESKKLFERRQDKDKYKDKSEREIEADLMPEAFALIREVSKRTIGIEQYEVQIKGAISIAEGRLAEMATGEGKTFVVPLVAYLHALSGKNVHVVTSNEYLAKRDKELMSKLFGFLGMKVGLSIAHMKVKDKQAAYACDITYTTASEVGFDYLRDNLCAPSERRLRGLNSLIIDEADHALLDDAITPLIISDKPNVSEEEKDAIKKAAEFVKSLEPCDYILEGAEPKIHEEIDIYNKESIAKHNKELDSSMLGNVYFSDFGFKKFEEYFGVENNIMNDDQLQMLAYCRNALKARFLQLRDRDYSVINGEVILTSQTTGRNMEGRQFGKGLQQAIEAKEGVKISGFTPTVARIDYQHFFRMYENIGGTSGTCKSDEAELQNVYNLSVDKIKTHEPVQRKDERMYFYETITEKEEAMFKKIEEYHESGRPILIGTPSVERSERLAEALKERGYEFELLNAKNEEKESKIIAQAGRKGKITISTNMAGRGTDIKLGGDPTQLAIEEMAKLGYSSELISFANSYLDTSTDEEKEARETFRKLKEKHKKITDAEKEDVEALGGLAVIGTCLNPSKRVDDQLRGRAGRQGEKGSSEFFVSWDDIVGINAKADEKTKDDIVGIDANAAQDRGIAPLTGTFILAPDNYIGKWIRGLKEGADDRIVLPDGQIKLPALLDEIEDIQHVTESKHRQLRERSCKLNDLESNQRDKFYELRLDLLNRLDDHGPKEVPERLLPIIQTWIEKQLDTTVKDFESQRKNDFPEAATQLRQFVEKYDADIDLSDSDLADEKLDQLKTRICESIMDAIKSRIKSLDSLPSKNKERLFEKIKKMIIDLCNAAWTGHLEAIDRASVQLNLSSQVNSQALYNFGRDARRSFNLTMDSLQDLCVETIVNKIYEQKTAVKSQTKEKAATPRHSTASTDAPSV